MKFDEVHAFLSAGEHGTKLTKTELALYYLSQFYSSEYREIRLAGMPTHQIAGELPEINEPIYSETIEFTHRDVLDYLVSVGLNIHPYA